jgi:hypothetical protein
MDVSSRRRRRIRTEATGIMHTTTIRGSQAAHRLPSLEVREPSRPD